MAYWVQTELGVIIAVIAFAPVILLMLNNKDLDPKAKKLCSLVAGVEMCIRDSPCTPKCRSRRTAR